MTRSIFILPRKRGQGNPVFVQNLEINPFITRKIHHCACFVNLYDFFVNFLHILAQGRSIHLFIFILVMFPHWGNAGVEGDSGKPGNTRYVLDHSEKIKCGEDGQFSVRQMNCQTNEMTGKAFVLSNEKTHKEFVLLTTARHFGVSVSPSGRWLLVFDNYASKENRCLLFETIEDEPHIKLIFETPPTRKDRTSWELEGWDEKNNLLILKKNGEEEGRETCRFNLSNGHQPTD